MNIDLRNDVYHSFQVIQMDRGPIRRGNNFVLSGHMYRRNQMMKLLYEVGTGAKLSAASMSKSTARSISEPAIRDS